MLINYVIITDIFLDFLTGKLFQDSVSIHNINSSVTTVISSEILDKNAIMQKLNLVDTEKFFWKSICKITAVRKKKKK